MKKVITNSRGQSIGGPEINQMCPKSRQHSIELLERGLDIMPSSFRCPRMIGDVNSSRFGLVESRSSLKVLKAHKMGISNPISSYEEASGRGLGKSL